MPNKQHLNLKRNEDCCGCRSCEQICPQQCNSMQEDYEAVRNSAIDENLVARHICVENEAELDQLHGVKDVAGATNSTYLKVKNLFNEYRTVLYTGCGCHIVGLRSFLGKD